MSSLPWQRAASGAVVLALLVAGLTASLSLPQADNPLVSEVLVGYTGEFPRLLIEGLGGHVDRIDATLGFAVVRTVVPDLLTSLAGVHPAIEYVEINGKIRSSSGVEADRVGWNSARWDASRWDASRWDAAKWDAAKWDAARWDAARWDAAKWDAAKWDAARWDSESTTPHADPGFGHQWHLGAIHAPTLWQRTVGYHTRIVCVVDTGVDYTHPDLATNVFTLPGGARGKDFVHNDDDPMDDGGHGTHMAGLISAVMGNNVGISGVSQAWILPVKVLDANGDGTDANLASGIAWCADNGAHIINLSLHSEAPTTTVNNAIAHAKSRGALILAASGNGGQRCDSCVYYPASHTGVLSIGATNESAKVTAFSNKGSRVDIVVPGALMLSTMPGDTYAVGSGTSQSTAVASGAAALFWSTALHLTGDQIAARMKAATKDDGPSGRDIEYGHGHLRLDYAP